MIAKTLVGILADVDCGGVALADDRITAEWAGPTIRTLRERNVR
ncbi:MAG: hypothetical protein ABIY56_10895 [Dokdonella sp.]